MTADVAGRRSPPGPAISSLKELASFAGAVGAAEAVGGLGAVATGPAVREWLPTLDQPSFQPPDWLFGPVWTLLYALIGISWRLARRAPDVAARRRAERLLAVQLALNALWSYVFFRRRRIGLALLDSMALTVAVGLTTAAVWRVSRLAAVLLVPYLAWVTFATVLNGELWRRNR